MLSRRSPRVGVSRGASGSIAPAVAFLALMLPLPREAAAAPGGPWTSPPAPAPVTFAGELQLFDAFSFDTGWQPPASPVQVRFEVYLGSGFTCTMDGTAGLAWPTALDLSFTPTAGSGELIMDVGLEVHSTYHLELTVAGITYTWEGEIPYLPNFDYRFADLVGFDPFLLPGAVPGTAMVSDVIPDTLLYEYDITDAIIPIPGIGGGVALYAGGQLDATLRGIDILVDPEIVTAEGEHVFPAVPGADPSLLRDAIWEGELLLEGTLVLTPTIFVELLGTTWDIAAFPIPVPFPAAPLPWALDPWPLDLPLPEIEVDAQSLSFAEVAQGSTVIEGVAVRNDGDLDLVVTATASGPGLTAAAAGAFVVPAHTIGTAAVAFSPTQAGAVMGELVLESNDPDEPVIVLPIYATGGEDLGSDAGAAADAGLPADAAADAGPADDDLPGGCSCRCAVAPPAGRSDPERPSPVPVASALVLALGLGVAWACVRLRPRLRLRVPRR